MSEYIINITEEETIQCQVCNEVFNTNEITTDDYYFAWDNIVDVDCCAECAVKEIENE
jgi:uncharacterized protein (DUF2225 family)